jgi:hypothetical protein
MADTFEINGETLETPANVTENADGSLSVSPVEKQEETKPKTERPEWLPEDFETPEAFAEAYKALKSAPAPEAPKEPLQIKSASDAEKAVKDAGLDLNALSAEYVKDGKLSEASMKTLAEKGIDQGTVDSYIEGQKARAAQFVTKLAESVGGVESLDAMMKWAATGLESADVESFNRMLRTDESSAKLAVLGLRAQYEAATGSPGQRVNGNPVPPSSGEKPFASQHEMVKAMQDPRYAEDPAYREKVMRRLEASENLVIVSSNRLL